jgi:hypothetical protein
MPRLLTHCRNQLHVLSCPKREELLSTLGDTLTNIHREPNLALMLIQGVQGSLSNQHFQMNHNNNEPIFCMLINSQNKIGWQHLLKGRFSKQWTTIQGRHILEDLELDQEKQSGSQWLKLALHHLWALVWQVWLTRNEDSHGRHGDERERKRLEKLLSRITALHAKQDLLLLAPNKFFWRDKRAKQVCRLED